MAKKEVNRSFDVAEYENSERPDFVVSAIHQTAKEMTSASPNYGVLVKTSGNQVTILYHSYEMNLPARVQIAKDAAEQVLKNSLTELKKGVKKKGVKNFDLKEVKDKAGYSIEKVSLNQRYYLRVWRIFDIS